MTFRSKLLETIYAQLEKSRTLNFEQATRFFKIQSDSYAAHDQFLGIKIPNVRKIAKIYTDLSLEEISHLLSSQWNEVRFLALVILVNQYQKGSQSDRSTIFNFYMSHIDCINNWNLVDCSSQHIIGHYLMDSDKTLIKELIQSNSLWKKRIAIIANLHLIKNDRLDLIYELACMLLDEKEDLIQKALGWMLREAGKKDVNRLRNFLFSRLKYLPRTTLRYAIEKFPKEERKYFLSK